MMNRRLAQPRREHLPRYLAAALCGMLAAACGNLVAGGVGQAEVRLTGNYSAPSPALMPTLSPAMAPMRASGDAPEGEVEAEFLLFLVTEEGAQVSLTPNGEIRVRVDLGGVEVERVADRAVPATRYSSLRVIFTEIEAEVDAGLIINGEPVTGPIRVEFDGILTVTRPLNIEIGDQEKAVLLVDLNADEWLQAVDPATATVDAQVFADLISVVVQ